MAMPSPSPRRGLTFVFPAFAAALLLAGCASTGGLAPREHPIEADSLASGRSLDVPALSDAAFPARDWWTALGDPQLDALVREALRDSRSEERRVGKECVSTGRTRWWAEHEKKNNNQTTTKKT